MKIGIDIRCLMEGRKTGVEEYTVNVLSNLFTIDSQNEYVLFLNSFSRVDIDLDWIKKFPKVRVKKFRIPNKLLNLAFWYLNWPHIDRMVGGLDVLFMPNIMFGSVSKQCRLVTTVHDLSFERFPEFFSWKRRFWHWLVNPRKICAKSHAVVTVSESSKQDLVDVYGLPDQKVVVIPNGVSDQFGIIDRNDSRLVQVKEKYRLPYRFILYFGTLEPRKNVISVIRAYHRFKQDIEDLKENNPFDYKLVIAGFSGWLEKEILQEIRTSKYKNSIILISCVEAEDRQYLFNLASLFVYPSFLEGFGLPVLEAMKCGLPVICSNNSSLPEVVGEAGILIDPDRPDEIYRAMRELIYRKDLQDKLRECGLARAKTFSWKKAAQELFEILKKV